MIVIADTDGNLPDGDNDLALVLQDRTIGSDGELGYVTTRHDTMAGFVGDTLVTNGVANFEMAVRREPYRIRLLNGANSQTQYLSWSSGAAVHVLATDGNLLPETVSVDGLVITPGSDLWIDFSTFEPGARVQLLAADTFVESGSPLGLTLDAPKQFILSTRRAAHWINNTQWEERVVTDVESAAWGCWCRCACSVGERHTSVGGPFRAINPDDPLSERLSDEGFRPARSAACSVIR